jgi:alkanesulfonate monooxygenase
VFPLLPQRSSKVANGPLSGPFGEIVGNSYLPKAASAS